VNRVAELRAGPRRLAELVGVVMEEPVGVERLRQLFFPPEDRRPVERVSLPFRRLSRELFDIEESLAQPLSRFRNGVVGRAIVDQVDIHAVLDQVADHRRDDVSLVVSGEKRDHSKGSGHSASYSGNVDRSDVNCTSVWEFDAMRLRTATGR
jgi:hypothetical protein